MSTNSSSATAIRKKQDEKNLTILRQLLSFLANKFCFECGQRGPTYANVTNGSFCCMHCSGLLRGLNPPHRVKSISLSTFSDDEMNKLKTTGNEVNMKIWLGMYDKKIKFEPRIDDEVRQHLIQKYENRRWYVSPDDLAQQEKLMDEHLANKSRKSSVIAAVSGDAAPISVAATTLQRRDSIKSHQSNQSAPPNLHPKDKQDPIDLLTSDLLFVPQKLPHPSNSTTSGVQISNESSSNMSESSTTGQTASPSAALRHRMMPQQQFNSSDTIFVQNKIITTSPEKKHVQNAFSTSSFAQTSFAQFDAQFDALKINVEPAKLNFPPISTSSSYIKPNSNSSSTQLPQRPASTTMSTTASSGNMLQFDNPMERHTGVLKDGKPIMSAPTNLPDYSALEELFRGNSGNSTGITTTSPSPFDAFGGVDWGTTNHGQSDVLGCNSTPTAPAFDAFSMTNFSKSNTMAGFQQNTVLPSNQFHSVSDFSSAKNFAQFPPSNVSTQKPPDDIAKNWNPFV